MRAQVRRAYHNSFEEPSLFLWGVLHMRERLKQLQQVAEKEVVRLAEQERVMAVGITGSLARKDVWERSDLDLVAVLDDEKDVFYVDFNDKPSVPIDIAFISKGLLTRRYHAFLYGCEITYDPTGILGKAVRNANRMFYSDAEVKRRIREYKTATEKNLNKAVEAIKRDAPSSVLHSRNAVFDVSSILMEKSRCLTSHHHGVGKREEAFKKLGLEELYAEFLSTIRLDKIDAEGAKPYILLLRRLYDVSYPFFYRLREEGLKPQIGFIFRLSKEEIVENRILPIYKTGHFRDFVNSVIEEYSDIARAVFNLNAKDMEDVISVFKELELLSLKPDDFRELYISAIDAEKVTKNEANAIISKASKFIKRVMKSTYNKYGGISES